MTAPSTPTLSLPANPSGRSVGWWGLLALVATESMVFALLLFGNFYLRAQAPQWPPAGVADPELKLSAIRTAILLGSSIPAVWAERAAKAGHRRSMLTGLGLTWLAGAVFLAGHTQEWVKLWPDLKPSTNAYGSVTYTITGLHGLHLVVGLVVVGYLFVRGAGGRYASGRRAPLEIGLWYWHFVDAVWVAVYTSLYLSVSLS
ncbi:MAG: heme-copper oxidase subunit III [Acidimicrobiales bacterium]